MKYVDTEYLSTYYMGCAMRIPHARVDDDLIYQL